MIHGSAVIASVPGPSVNTRNGVPGAESRPSDTATMRSSAPRAFQTPSHAGGSLVSPAAMAASGIARAATSMSPAPATGANGADRRPSAARIRKKTPPSLAAFNPTRAGSGTASSALLNRGRRNQPPNSSARSPTKANTGAGTGPVAPGAKPPSAAVTTMVPPHPAAAAKAASFVGRLTGENPTRTPTSAA